MRSYEGATLFLTTVPAEMGFLFIMGRYVYVFRETASKDGLEFLLFFFFEEVELINNYV